MGWRGWTSRHVQEGKRTGGRGGCPKGESLVKSLRQLSEKLPENLSFSVLVPALVNGINSQRVARKMAEVECWIQALKGPDGALMRRARELFLGQMELHVLGRVFKQEKTMARCRTASGATTMCQRCSRGGREWPRRSSLCPYL